MLQPGKGTIQKIKGISKEVKILHINGQIYCRLMLATATGVQSFCKKKIANEKYADMQVESLKMSNNIITPRSKKFLL